VIPVRFAPRRWPALFLVALVSGCMAAPVASPGAAPPGSPAASADLSTACAGAGQVAEPTRYAGWPPAETFELVPVPIASELAVGRNRFLLNLLDNRNEPLAAPDRPVRLRFFDLATDPTAPASEVATAYLPTTEDLPGLYRAEVEFSCWGEWGVEAVTTEADGSERTGRMIFPVRPVSSTPAVGEAAPPSETPTAASAAEIAAISTDTDPDPDFYTTSVDDAVAAGRPFLVIFSTPAFCRTRTCGPALDIVKSVAPDFDDVAFIHVEPYELAMVEGQLQPALSEENQPVPVPAVTEWRLPTEPYIFVVDGDGRVAAKMEGVASAEEIRAALDGVTGSN
jgi:hypothetical protein